MKAGPAVRALVCALAFAFALAPAAAAQSTQPEPPPRRPQGPAAGPAIKLPPGANAAEERAPATNAREQAAPASSLPQKWEYCFISGFRTRQKSVGISSSVQVVVAYVRYPPEGSEEIEGATEEEALANALLKLGEDGWELTAVRTDLRLEDGDGKTTSAYFFKRPKRQE
jgi:hypothetical protein